MLELQKQIEYLQQQLQQLQKQQKPQPQQSNNLSNEFIIKSGMKASYIALRVEQILMLNKTVVISALGYAVPVLLDTIFLVRKDLNRMGKNINVSIELFEREVSTNGKTKTISGIKATLSI